MEQTCWHTPEVINEMNRFYDAHCKDMQVLRHIHAFAQLLNYTDEKNCPLLDLGCGTGMLSEFCRENKYVGADLPHIISGCAMRNHPQYYYRGCNIEADDLNWIKEYKIIALNAVIDIMQHPLIMLEKILNSSAKFVIIHRQEITQEGETRSVQNPSYGGITWHSIISRKDFNSVIDKCNFEIKKEIPLDFGNWENGGSSFLLRKRESWALGEIDFKLDKVFNGKQNGFFIEAGSNDGRRQSNTLYLEFYRNWKGILIEPVEEQYLQCRENRSKSSICENCAIVNDESIKEIQIRHFPECYGLLSIINEEKYFGNIVHAQEAGEIRMSKARTLNSILEQHRDKFRHIDLLVFDMEGYEPEALRGVDFSKWKIDYLLIEERENTSTISDLLLPWYERIDKLSHHDYLYKRKI